MLFVSTDLSDSCDRRFHPCCLYLQTWLTVMEKYYSHVVCTYRPDWRLWQRISPMLFVSTDLTDGCDREFPPCCLYLQTWLTAMAEDFFHVVCIYRPDWRLWQRISSMLFVSTDLTDSCDRGFHTCCLYLQIWLTVMEKDFSHVVCIYRPVWQLWQRISLMLFVSTDLTDGCDRGFHSCCSYWLTWLTVMAEDFCHVVLHEMSRKQLIIIVTAPVVRDRGQGTVTVIAWEENMNLKTTLQFNFLEMIPHDVCAFIENYFKNWCVYFSC